MGTAHTLIKVNMMATKMNFVNPPTHVLIKDTQDQNNGNYGIIPSEIASQVIITQPILTNLVNGQITVKKIGRGSTIRNRVAFSIKVPLSLSGKSIKNCTNKKEKERTKHYSLMNYWP